MARPKIPSESPANISFRRISEQLESLTASDNSARDSIARLNQAASEDSGYASELAAIEAAESESMRAWAATGAGEAPQPMKAERDALDSRYSVIRQRAAAARAALPAFQSTIQATQTKRQAIAREAELIAFDLLQTEFDPAFAELEAALARAKAARIAVNALAEAAFALGRARHKRAPDSGRPMLAWAEQQSRRLADTLQPIDAPVGPTRGAYIAEVHAGVRAVVERIAKDSFGLVNLEGA